MNQLRRGSLVVILIAIGVVHAAAQTALVTELATFKPPYRVVQGAIAKLPDGRIFGLLEGGINGAIYKAAPNGSGGYTQTVVYEFGNEPGPFSSFTPSNLLVAPDGKIYYAGSTLWRFDPDAVTVQHLWGLNPPTNALRMGIDGHTIFGSSFNGRIFSWDIASDTFRDIIGGGPSGLNSVEQMSDGNLVAGYTPSGDGVYLRRIDPATGAYIGEFHENPASMTPLSKGDDGIVYVEISFFWGRTYYRINPGCFCLNDFFGEPFPTPAVRTIAGPRNGRLYIDRDFHPHRLDLTTTPPRLERLADGPSTSRYNLAADGTLFMFSDTQVYALDTNTAVAESTPTALVGTGMINDGVNGFPSDYTEGPDGMLYGVSGRTETSHASIFRIDPNTRARAMVGEVGVGGSYQNNAYTTKLLLVGQQLYGTYYNDYLSSAIFRFDPSTNAVDIVRAFPFDYDAWILGPDGALIHDISLGRDGWLYSMMDYTDPDSTGDWTASIVRIDPASGAFETLARPVFPQSFYTTGKLTETADGIWLGVYWGGSIVCERLFRFDAATNTVTHFKDLRTAVEGCGTRLARRADGAIFGAMLFGGLPAADGYGGGNIFQIDPESGDITKLVQFTLGSPVRFPTGTLSFGADGFLYTSYSIYDNGVSTNGLARIDLAAGTATSLAELPRSYGFLADGFFIGSDGRFFTGLSAMPKAWSVGVLDAMPLSIASAPFGGTTDVSATLKATGIPMAGRTIAFTLNGGTIGSALTNAQGVATLTNVSVQGVAIGTYPNAIGASFAGEEFFPATSGSGSLTVYDVPTPGLMIGHGFVRPNDVKHEFAFIVVELANGAEVGGFELTRKNKGKAKEDRFVSVALNGVVFDDDTVTFAGTGKWNGVGGYRFQAVAEDVSGPGNHDTLRVTIYDGANQVVVTFDQEIEGGNIQALRLR